MGQKETWSLGSTLFIDEDAMSRVGHVGGQHNEIVGRDTQDALHVCILKGLENL